MRTVSRRAWTGLSVVVAIGFVAMPGWRPVTAQPNAGVTVLIEDTGEPPTADGFDALSLPSDRDATQRYQAVLDYLARERNIPWDVVCGTAQQLLDSKSDSFFEIDEAAGGGPPRKRFVSIKDQTGKLIGGFPKDGRQFYQLTFGPPAQAALQVAIAGGYDQAQLTAVSQTFFHTDAGGEAALLLATLQLRQGNYTEAAYGFDRLLARPGSDALLTPLTLFKAAVAFKRAPDRAAAGRVQELMDRLARAMPRDGVVIGRRAYSLRDLEAELARPAGLLFGRVGDEFVTARYGNAAHTGVGDGGTPFLSPAFVSRMLQLPDDATPQDARDWILQATTKAISYLNQGKSRGQVALPGFFPVTAPNRIIYRTYDGVYCRSTVDGATSQAGEPLNAGQLVWQIPTQMGLHSIMAQVTSPDRNQIKKETVEGWWQSCWEKRMPTLVYENAQVGSLSHDGKLVYYVDDVALPPPAQGYDGSMGRFPAGGRDAGATSNAAGYSKLVALDIETGQVFWELGGATDRKLTEEQERATSDVSLLTENSVFLGPPVPVSGKIYVLYERDNRLRVSCLDAHKRIEKKLPDGKVVNYPELVWSQDLGRPSTPIGQDSLRRIQPAYLAYADGVLVCPTNCGAVIAVDVNARSLIWARGYADAGPPAARPDPRFRRPVPYNSNQPLPEDRWRASAPIIADGKVIVTAHDSEQIQCFDLRTGNGVWADAREKDDLYVGGVVAGRVIVVGKTAVRAYPLAGEGKPAWKQLRIGTPAGHGVATDDGLFYVPMVGDPDRPDSTQPQVWAIDAATGQVRTKTAFREKTIEYADRYEPKDTRVVLGNLVFHDGQLFSQSATRLSAFPLIERKKLEMDRLLATNPTDPKGLTFRGELLLDDGKVAAAIADFKAAQKNDPADDVRRTIREKLYLAYTDLLRTDFDAAEGVLGEYEALCEIPIDTDVESKRQELLDEQNRRKGLYLSLVARGRERQGRLVEAFEHYRAFAALGDNTRLVSIFDEPEGMTRPDVWARGRIDAMIRTAKDPAVRKPLEDRVRADWEAVRGANDLGRLREFVQVFGPYFPAGRQAQLLLSEKLLQTNNDDDAREAQIQLMQLWATSEDETTTAKAIDTLARVMTRRGMIEDAVGLYARLGTEFADTVVRDGRTGAEIYGDLITDKRLLPYLEPSSGPTMSDFDVKIDKGNTGQPAGQQSFTIEPDGDLLPFFRRHQLTMEMSRNGGNQTEPWALRVTDRLTGEDRCTFDRLSVINSREGFSQGPPAYRAAQASGHLLLLNIGQFAYCFDLAEKRELWRYDLFENNWNNFQEPGQQPQPQPPQPGEDPNELVVRYPDGWTLRLGRSAVIQPNYVCLITRDGLVAVDPYTKEPLWQRSNVSTKAQVFGDARHLFLVETTSAGTTAKVLRAVDGSVIEGTPDFAAMFASPARIGVIGRRILLSEGGDDKPRTLRLFDPLTGKNVWSRGYPGTAVLVSSNDPGLTGCLNRDGTFDLVRAATGEVLFEGRLDADRVRDHLYKNGEFAVVEPYVLTDATQVYLFLNRKTTGVAARNRGGYTMIRSHPVNGVAYGFDRASGERLWFYDGPFNDQLLVLERFDELPVLIAAAQVVNPDTRRTEYAVVVLDKKACRLRKRESCPPNGGVFVSMYTEPKTGAIVVWRHDLKLKIVPASPAPKPE